MTTAKTLSDVEIIHLDIRIFSGNRKLEAGDFDRVDPTDLPDAAVASLGQKRTIALEALKPLRDVRYQAEKICHAHGVRFLGAFAVPQDLVPRVTQELSALMAEFRQKKEEFIASYDALVEDWIRENPSFEDQIRRAKLPLDVVRSRFHADFTVFRVTASDRDTTGSLSSASASLLDAVLEGTAQALGEYAEKIRHWKNGGQFRGVVRQSIRTVAEKLHRFSFLTDDGSLTAFALQLENAVAGDGPIKDEDYHRLAVVIRDLGDLEAVKARLAALAGTTAALSVAPEANPAQVAALIPAVPSPALLPSWDLPAAPAQAVSTAQQDKDELPLPEKAEDEPEAPVLPVRKASRGFSMSSLKW